MSAVIVGKPSAAEMAQFLHLCQSKDLDPFQRDLYLICRGGKASFQVGIEGLRKIANRWAAENGFLLGSKAPKFYDAEGKAWPFPPKSLAAIEWTITVDGPNGLSSERTAVATMAEYKQNGGLWGSKPAVMLAKVAESIALRQAAPEATGGVYTHDEMPDVELPAVGYKEADNPFEIDSEMGDKFTPVSEVKTKMYQAALDGGLSAEDAKGICGATWTYVQPGDGEGVHEDVVSKLMLALETNIENYHAENTEEDPFA